MPLLRDLSLQQRLTLTLGGLTVAVLLTTVAVAYNEVRVSARMAGEERLAGVAEQLAALVEASAAERLAEVDSLVAGPVVRETLLGSPLTDERRERLEGAMASLRTASDAGLPVQLLDDEGRLLFSHGVEVGGSPGADVDPGLDSVVTWGRLRPDGDHAVFWTVFPARLEGEIVGWVAQQRRIAGSESAGPIQELVGRDAVVSFLHLADTAWVSLSGRLTAAPVQGPPTREAFTFRRAGAQRLALVAPIEATPWGVAVDVPMAAVSARPRAFLGYMAGVGAVLLLATVILGRLLGRRLSGPIRELAAASDGVAAGDYDRRVSAERGDELGRLARAFNTMASRVSESHDELRLHAADLERANVEAEEARREAQAANRAKSDFLATMSHEVRTPINAILGYTELLRTGIVGPLNEGQAENLERIERSSRLLIALVEDVLDFAQMESGELRVEAGRGSMARAIEGASAVIEPQAERKGVVLAAHACGDGAHFAGDPRRVEQILLNLMSNAVKFTPKGGRVDVSCGRVAEGPPGVGAELPDGWLRVDVRDTGIGVAPEQLERVFEPFVQADSGYTRDYGGVGLGLSISRDLAEVMGGKVTAESEPGRGSRFTLWLRAADGGEPRAGELAADAAAG